MKQYFSWLPIIVSAVVSWVSTPLVLKLVKRWGLIDDPQHHKTKATHNRPLPRGGGLAAFIAISTALLIFLPLDKITLSIIASLSIITIYGLIDDKKDLNPYLRFLLQIGVATIPVLAGVRINFTTNPFTQGVLNLDGTGLFFQALPFIFSVCWIVFLMNILNMGAKGIDGQLSGVVTISALTIAVLSQKYSADIAQWPVIVLSLIVAGSFLGMIPWNVYPQKIMPSFSGSNIGGFMLGVLSILSTATVGTLLVTLGIPIIDTLYVMTKRVLAGKSPVWGDKGHLHHRLLDLGISRRRIAYLYWASTAILGMIALNLNATSKIYTILGLIFFLGGVALFLKYAKNQKSNS